MSLKINLSPEDVAPPKNFDVLPSGKYVCNITDGSREVVKPGKANVGKPYWKLTFVIQEGPHAGRSIFSTVMLFEGAAWGLSHLMQALGYELEAGVFEIPELDDIIGRTVIVRGIKRPAGTDPKTGAELQERFEVKGYIAPPAKKSVDTSILP